MEKIKENREKRNKYYKEATTGNLKVWKDFIDNDPDWKIMRKKYTKEFYNLYDEAINCFSKGDWKEAESFFNKANVRNIFFN